MEEEKVYIGAKIIRAIPMDSRTFHLTVRGLGDSLQTDKDGNGVPGYLVRYPDGYVSWSPKETFETAYREVTDGERKLF